MKRPSRLCSGALSVLLPALIVGVAIPFSSVWAEVPSGPPQFTNPLNIDNAFFPFQPGGWKVFTGSDHGTKTAAIDYYLTATRTFRLNSKNVPCRVLVEEAYEDTALVERSFNYFAQADDGAVPGDDRIHRLDRFAPALIVEARRSRHERGECQAGEAIGGVRFQDLVQRLLHRRPHFGIIIERMGKPPLPGRHSKAGILQFDRASFCRESLLAQVARQRAQKSP